MNSKPITPSYGQKRSSDLRLATIDAANIQTISGESWEEFALRESRLAFKAVVGYAQNRKFVSTLWRELM